MNGPAVGFVLISAIALLLLPRRWAPLSLLVGVCYMTLGQGIELGPFHFMVIRILVAVGIVRVIVRGERLAGNMNALDWLMVTWAVWALISSFFHEDTPSVLVNRLGLVYNACGIYFLLRIFCQSLDDAVTLCRVTAFLLVPLSIMILFEKVTSDNLFSALGGVSEVSEIRDGKVRAQGPFAHSILAGTVGAVCLPLMAGIWRQYLKTAVAGIAACLAIIFASASSGPILSALWAIGAMYMWQWRHQMRLVRWLAVLGYIGLGLIMKAPAYYLIARIDLTGSSTSWHRAALIESALTHISEWWFAGTDVTRHWMPYGVDWSVAQSDITNHYLMMGVAGGLPLMLLFMGVLVRGYSFVGRMLQMSELSPQSRFMIWAFGASLFVHSITFISVSYFDQSFVFIYLSLAIIGSTWSGTVLRTSGEVVRGKQVHGLSDQHDRRIQHPLSQHKQ